MDILEATRKYETWLGSRIPLIRKDLETRHQSMAASAFRFLRATFYRWMQIWAQACSDLAGAPETVALVAARGSGRHAVLRWARLADRYD